MFIVEIFYRESFDIMIILYHIHVLIFLLTSIMLTLTDLNFHTKSFGSKYASNAAELYMSYLYWTYCTLSLTSILSFSSFSHHVASLMLSSVTRELTLSFRSLFSINKAVLSACNSTHCCCKASIKGWCPHSRSC